MSSAATKACLAATPSGVVACMFKFLDLLSHRRFQTVNKAMQEVGMSPTSWPLQLAVLGAIYGMGIEKKCDFAKAASLLESAPESASRDTLTGLLGLERTQWGFDEGAVLHERGWRLFASSAAKGEFYGSYWDAERQVRRSGHGSSDKAKAVKARLEPLSRELERRASRGDAQARFELARLLNNTDTARSQQLFRLAAAQHHAGALHEIEDDAAVSRLAYPPAVVTRGFRFLASGDAAQGPLAVRLLEQAAAGGMLFAHYILGAYWEALLPFKPSGGADLMRAFEHFSIAAEQGHTEATARVADSFVRGITLADGKVALAADKDKAAATLKRTADLGCDLSQSKLKKLKETGSATL